jgi:hypothetical protein
MVVKVESSIKGIQYVKNENIRREVEKTMKAHKSKQVGGFEEEKEAFDSLKERDCYFLKAEKGNSAVVFGQIGIPYKILERTPLPRMKREALACLSAVSPDPKLRWRLRVTNYQVPGL